MRILYLADIRFPLERANGIQTMETCHALASRGHRVSLAVRPDTHEPRRDPYEFYGLPRIPATAKAAEKATEYTDYTERAAEKATEYTDYTEKVAEKATEYTDYTDYTGKGSLNIEIVPVTGPPAARRTGYVTFAIGRALGRVRQDIIFTRDLGLAAILVRLPRLVRGPVVYEAHTIAADEAATRHEMLTGAAKASPSKLRRLAAREASVWRRADGYVTITAGLKAELEHRFGPRQNVAVVPDGVRGRFPVSSSQFPDRSGSPFTIGYAGHLYPWKGVDLIIEAVAALPDTRALIVGGHPQEPDLARVREFASQLDCASRVEFTGMVAPPDVAARMRQANVLVLPNPASAISNAYTSPLKLFEYMASGRPIVASDLPSIREILVDDRNALLTAPGDPQALTAAIRRIKEDEALGARLAAQALEDVRGYTWETRAARLEALFGAIQ